MNTTNLLNDGICPAMITPYDEKGAVDYDAVAAITRWYASKGCQGIFATCLSGEIFDLTLEERVNIAKTVIKTAPKNIDIVVSGHISDTIDAQIEELTEMSKTQAKAVVLVSNRLASKSEDDDILIANINKILNSIPDTYFGLYEAPYPYRRLLSPRVMKYSADSGRFLFMKDTCCNISEIKAKLKAIEGSPLKLYNANSATYLDSLMCGASGLCGVMANFHPELYIKLTNLYTAGNLEGAIRLQSFVGLMSIAQYQMYPLNAKYYMQLEGLPIKTVFCRNRKDESMDDSMRLEIEQMRAFTHNYSANLFELTEDSKAAPAALHRKLS